MQPIYSELLWMYWDQEEVMMWRTDHCKFTIVCLVLLSFEWHPLISQFKINDTFLSSLKLNYFLFNIFPQFLKVNLKFLLNWDVGTIENNRVQNKWTGFLTTISRTIFNNYFKVICNPTQVSAIVLFLRSALYCNSTINPLLFYICWALHMYR